MGYFRVDKERNTFVQHKPTKFVLFTVANKYRKCRVVKTEMTEDKVKEKNSFIEIQFDAKGARSGESKKREERRKSASKQVKLREK